MKTIDKWYNTHWWKARTWFCVRTINGLMVFFVFICGANGKTELAGFWLTGWAWIYLTCFAKALQEGAESRLEGSFLYRALSLRSTFYRRFHSETAPGRRRYQSCKFRTKSLFMPVRSLFILPFAPIFLTFPAKSKFHFPVRSLLHIPANSLHLFQPGHYLFFQPSQYSSIA